MVGYWLAILVCLVLSLYHWCGLTVEKGREECDLPQRFPFLPFLDFWFRMADHLELLRGFDLWLSITRLIEFREFGSL